MKIIVRSIYSVVFVLLFSSVMMTGCKKDEYEKKEDEKKEDENEPPVADFSISSKLSSTLGYVDTLFTFDASVCIDDRTPTSKLIVRWDFDGNGTYDTDWSTEKSSLFKYGKDGEYTVNIEVKDEDGEVSIESKSLTVILPTFTDSRDNKIYKTIIIGNQVWMAENLAYEIPGKEITDGNVWGDNEAFDGWCYYNNDKIAYGDKYGILYQWEAALSASPSGWHLPSEKEWIELRNFLANNGFNYDGTIGDNEHKTGKAIASKSGWQISHEIGAVGNNQASNNSSGFTALPTGLRMHYMGFMYFGTESSWWTSSEQGSQSAITPRMRYERKDFEFGSIAKNVGMSIRCIKD